jgi:hypothetical protein
MKTKSEIVANWLPRYTGTPLKAFGKHILLVNFNNYVRMFAKWHNVPVHGHDKPMPNATADGITIINFGMGSASAATIMDLLSAIQPKAVMFLGKCGGVKHVAHRSHPWRGRVQRLLSAGSSRTAGVQFAEGDLDNDPRSQTRLLDGHGLYDEPPRLGTRLEIQKIPAQDPLHRD